MSLCSFSLSNTSSFLTWSVQLISPSSKTTFQNFPCTSNIINIEVHFVGYLYIMGLIIVSISMKQTLLQVSSAYVNVFVVRLCVTQDLWCDFECDTGFVMRLWVWHRICGETVGVTQDFWWDCVCDTGFVMWLGVWHRICDVTLSVTQDLWWDCGCDAGFVMWLWVWHRICDETVGVTQDLW